jgi:AcrR family transcriptional regulator
MMTNAKPATPTTGDLLIQAAEHEFRDHGFAGTDSNKIARRAGYAPQTFYRWFSDKTAVFLAVYRRWEDEERRILGDLVRRGAGDAELVEATVTHHRDHLRFRRSLRLLSLEVEAVRRARADSRLRQISRIEKAGAAPGLSLEAAAVRLLQIERLADALAEGELADMGVGEAEARARLADLIGGLGRPREAPPTSSRTGR